MITIHRHFLVYGLVLVLLGSASCASMPKIEKPRFTQRHYTYSVLLVPEMLGKSPHLELALSLLRMEYPADQAEAFHNMLYSQSDIDAYKDFILNEQRKNYRGKAGDLPRDGSGTASFNWRYAERFGVKHVFEKGIVIKRDLETYYGGANSGNITRYYNIIIESNEESNELRLLTLDDLFDNFQENQKFRDVVYETLRGYSKLTNGQPFTQGGYFNNQPELSFNFFITEEGLTLRWDPAQIAPRAQGSIEIILPWYTIQPLMLVEGIELLEKFDIFLFDWKREVELLPPVDEEQ